MAETATRIYIIFLCMNLALTMGGATVVGDANIADASYNSTGGIASSSDIGGSISGILAFLTTVISFLLGGGIAAMLISAGMPEEIQLIIGVPMLALAYLALAPLISRFVGFAGRMI